MWWANKMNVRILSFGVQPQPHKLVVQSNWEDEVNGPVLSDLKNAFAHGRCHYVSLYNNFDLVHSRSCRLSTGCVTSHRNALDKRYCYHHLCRHSTPFLQHNPSFIPFTQSTFHPTQPLFHLVSHSASFLQQYPCFIRIQCREFMSHYEHTVTSLPADQPITLHHWNPIWQTSRRSLKPHLTCLDADSVIVYLIAKLSCEVTLHVHTDNIPSSLPSVEHRHQDTTLYLSNCTMAPMSIPSLQTCCQLRSRPTSDDRPRSSLVASHPRCVENWTRPYRWGISL